MMLMNLVAQMGQPASVNHTPAFLAAPRDSRSLSIAKLELPNSTIRAQNNNYNKNNKLNLN